MKMSDQWLRFSFFNRDVWRKDPIYGQQQQYQQQQQQHQYDPYGQHQQPQQQPYESGYGYSSTGSRTMDV